MRADSFIDVAELAGQDEASSLARHRGRLDEEHVAAGRRHRQAGRDAGHRRAVAPPPGRTSGARAPRARPSRRSATGGVALPAAIRVAVLRSSVPSSRSSWRTPASRVYSVITVADDGVVDARPRPRRSPFRSHLARPQVAARDRDLLLDRVAVEADDLHAVEQRTGDRVGDVRGRDEERPARGRARRRGSGRGTSGSAPGRAPRAAPRDGSPRQSAPTLSTSSSMITGFIVPASRSARTSRPGSAPMYVRRWPRISASSRTPPSDMRTNSRPVARAIDSPIDVLPVPGRPDERQDGARAPVVGHAALGAELAHREVLDDALLHVVEAGVVGVEHLARVRGSSAPRSASPTARRAASRGRCGSSTTLGLCSPMRSSRPSSRSACSLHGVGHAGLGDLLPVLLGDRAPRPRRAPCGSSRAGCGGSSRCCFCAPDSTSSRMRLRTCSSASRSRCRAERQGSSRSTTSRRLAAARPSARRRGRASSPPCRRARRAR